MNESAPVQADLDAATRVFCLKCGYDLTPIPLGQCSECGYGYDHEAIRRIASEFTLDRIGSYRSGTCLSAVSALCSLLIIAVENWTGLVFLVFALLFVVFLIDFSAAEQGKFTKASLFRAGSRLLLVAILTVMAIAFRAPGFVAVGVITTGVLAGFAGLNRSSEYQFIERSASVAHQKKLIQSQRVYIAMLIFAILIGLIAIVQ